MFFVCVCVRVVCGPCADLGRGSCALRPQPIHPSARNTGSTRPHHRTPRPSRHTQPSSARASRGKEERGRGERDAGESAPAAASATRRGGAPAVANVQAGGRGAGGVTARAESSAQAVRRPQARGAGRVCRRDGAACAEEQTQAVRRAAAALQRGGPSVRPYT